MTVRNLTRGTIVAERLEAALRTVDRMRGLLGRDDLDADDSLWIAPCASIHTIGMRFVIDAAFLDRQGRVLRLYRALGPRRVTRVVWGAKGVLELASGALDRSGTEVGDVLDLGLARG